jgi:hypothetical protein
MLARLATEWHVPESEATETMSTGHLTEVAAALGAHDEVELACMDSNLTLIGRPALVDLMTEGIKKLSSKLGLKWEDVQENIEQQAAERAKEVCTPPVFCKLALLPFRFLFLDSVWCHATGDR